MNIFNILKRSSHWLLLLLSILIALPCLAQDGGDDPCQQVMDKSSEKLYKKARDLQKRGDKEEAFEIYNEILEEHPEYLEVNYFYAMGLYMPTEKNQYQSSRKDKADVIRALECFNRMYDVCPYFKIHSNLYAARLAWGMERYAEAVKFAQVIVDNPDEFTNSRDTMLQEAKIIVRRASFFAKILANPVPFDPKAVEGISTPADEYLGTLSPDGDYFYFTRRQEVTDNSRFGGGEKTQKEFFSYSKKKNGVFGNGAPLPEPFNNAQGEGSPTINITNDLIIFAKLVPTTLTGNNGNYTYKNYDLYYSEYSDGAWSEPASLGPNVNRKDSWESQPSLSSDGRVLFFASDRPGSLGGSDIWMTRRSSDGSWGKPINLGPTINTTRDERSPFLHTDSKTLYFSSNGLDGMGGQDVFYSKLDEKNQWTQPKNLGYPINSNGDDVNFFVSLDGKTGYFCSRKVDEKTQEKEDWNFYEFELYEEARPHTMMIVKGSVTADDDDLEGAIVEIRDTATNVIATGVVSSTTKQYAVATERKVDNPEPVIVTVKKEGHSYDSHVVTAEQMKEPVVVKDAEVKSIETGKVCNLRDIYFETNSYNLTQSSQVVVKLFVEFLKDNPTVKVEIQGHTDNVGNDNDNLLLSERRAKAVYDIVVKMGIPADRLRYKGYGESQPIADNNTASGRAQNRRTVFLIYDK